MQRTDTAHIAERQQLKPVLDGDWRVIGPRPDLAGLGLQPMAGAARGVEPNDHTIFQGPDGRWHLWACVRGTAVGRVLCHWEGASLLESNWRFTGEIIRADRRAGESLVEWQNQEFLQSPFVVQDNGTYYMFYGGYDTGLDTNGQALDPAVDYDHAEKQICLMTSSDGRRWQRHKNAQGFSRLFAGPGAARDECVANFGGIWHIYYAGHHGGNRAKAAIYVRTSGDLLHWSAWKIAHYDADGGQGKKHFEPESPFVVFRGGYYYLFRTHGKEPGTHVFRSENPLDFGGGDAGKNFVTRLPVIAPEIVVDAGGQEYISNIHDEKNGYVIRICRLRWEPCGP